MIETAKNIHIVWAGDLMYWVSFLFMISSIIYNIVQAIRLRRTDKELLESHKQMADTSLVIVTKLEKEYRGRIVQIDQLTADLDAELEDWRNRNRGLKV